MNFFSFRRHTHFHDWYRLYVLLFFISLIFSVILAFVVSHNKFQEIQIGVSNDVEYLDKISGIIERHLWMYDFKAIEFIAATLLERDSVQSIKVKYLNNYEVINNNSPDKVSFRTKKFVNKLLTEDGLDEIGYLEYQLYVEDDAALIVKVIFQVFLFFIVVFFFSSLLIYVYINHFVTGPLDKLSKAIDLTVLSGEPVKTQISDKTRFGRFATQFNLMQTKLENEQMVLAKSLEQLQAQTKLVEDQSILLENVMRGVGQSVSYFDQNLKLVECDVGDESYSIFKDIPVAPYKEIEALNTALIQKNHQVRIISEQKDNILYELESLSPTNCSLNIKALDLKESGLAIICTDITQAKEIESSLRQAQKLEAIGLLSSGIAHDLNNYLTIIFNSLTILNIKNIENNAPDEDVNMIIDSSIGTVKRASKVVQGLLAFTRSKPIEKKLLHPLDIVSHLNLMITSSTIGEKVEFSIDMRTSLQFFADEDMLQTCLLNLIINARDAIKNEGSILLIVYKVNDQKIIPMGLDKNIQYIVFEVQDTGIGIPSNLSDKIFDPFFTTKNIGEGTGLGLSAVYGFAKQMKGSLNFENNPDGGATFRLILPGGDSVV